MTTTKPTRAVPDVPRVPLKVGYHQTLSEVLSALGWTHERLLPGDLAYAAEGRSLDGLRAAGKRKVMARDGRVVGLLDVFECWDFLRNAGLIAPAKDDTP